MSNCSSDLQVFSTLLIAKHFSPLGWFYSLIAAPLCGYPMILAFPTSWHLQEKVGFNFTASHRGRDGSQYGPHHWLKLSWPQWLTLFLMQNTLPISLILDLNIRTTWLKLSSSTAFWAETCLLFQLHLHQHSVYHVFLLWRSFAILELSL